MPRVLRVITHPLLPLALALAAYLLLTGLSVQAYFRIRPQAQFTYALDDPYIHMAIAKNLAQRGVFGVTPDGFTSSSSSILWVLMLSLVYWIFGVSDLAPLWLNLIFASLAVFFAWRILRRLVRDHPMLLLAGLLALVYFTPLAPETLTGMETTLQIATCLAFADIAMIILSRREKTLERKYFLWLLASGVVFATARYEDLALLAFVCFLLLLQKRFRLALLLGGAALLPLALYGAVSLMAGWHFLPNSVLVKSAATAMGWRNPWAILSNRFLQLSLLPNLFFLWALFLAGLALGLIEWVRPFIHPEGRWLLLIFPPALLAQALFGQLGWFYRYEAYVIALGTVAVLGVIGGWIACIPRRERAWVPWTEWDLRIALAAFACLMLLGPLYERGRNAQRDTAAGMANIYDQQIHMARFLKTYFSGSCVVINDIGAISYMGDVCIIDLAGLATQETAEAVLQARSLMPVIERLYREKNARLAVVYDSWYPHVLPPEWIPVGWWTLDRQVVAGGRTVTFYATHPEDVARLRQDLIDFAASLPPQETWQVR